MNRFESGVDGGHKNVNTGIEDKDSLEIDLLVQASKNLSESSPIDVAEDGSTSRLSVNTTLPIELANLLNLTDNKKRLKKNHSRLRRRSIWPEQEDYFRRFESPDLESLSDLASLRSLSSGNCFSVPSLETDESAKNVDVVCEGTVGNEISSESNYSGSVEWVLGIRNRILLTSERPCKKQKILGGDEGLGKLIVAVPCEGNELLCDFCCTGDLNSHQLIVCTSCKATVHKKCYGLNEDIDESWLCSLCKLKNGSGGVSERLCLLCPKKGGILKQVLSKTEPAEFAHLFCALWMPEVCIEDLKKMEPILILHRIEETQTKLLCYLCKVNSGFCIRCCNGTCQTSFHPICAREAGNRLEVWGKHGCDTVELRAFCSKHSDSQESRKSRGETNAVDGRSPVCHLPSESVREGHLSNDETGVDVGTPESGMTGRNNEDIETLSKSLGFGLLVKKLVDLGKVDVKILAADIGVNPDTLSATLRDGDFLPDLLAKVVQWLRQHALIGSVNKGGNLQPKNTTKSKASGSVLKKQGSVSLTSAHSPVEQKSIVLDPEIHHRKSSVLPSDNHGDQSNSSSCGVMLENAFSFGPSGSQNRGNLNRHTSIILDLLDHKAYPGFNPHPYIHRELTELGKGQTLNNSTDSSDVAMMTTKPDGFEEGSGNHITCHNHQDQSADCGDTSRQLSKARDLGILDLFPEDEVDGELLYYQRRLLDTTFSRKQLSDNLVYEVAKKLPLEIDEQHGRIWNDALVNKYFQDLAKSRKQGRKERRRKQAQSVLATSTAAVTRPSRNTSLRTDMSEEPAPQEMSTSRRKVVGTSHQVLQTNETLLKSAVSGPPSEKPSDHHTPEYSVENPRTCDICRRSDTICNLIVVCSSCKVAVHMDCYKFAIESTGPWYCELCAESSSEPSFNFREKPNSSTECTLCGGTTGAFRKSTNGQWVHAFCAEWTFESTFKRGQINPVQGMESLAKNTKTCCLCQRICGASFKCSYGNCQTTFHPYCARSAGFHMSGKLPHKAYCEKHSLEQKEKSDSQKHGAEEQKRLTILRVELERLRLLCERVVKREKLKRELVISSHEILDAKKNHAARSLHIRNPFSPPKVSGSATPSIKGHPDRNISGNEAIQRSDDIITNRKVSVKRRGKGPISSWPTKKQNLSAETVPRKLRIGSSNISEDGDKVAKPKKRVETFPNESMMTSDEASLKNRRLPKGYVYVPIPEENQNAVSSDKPGNQKAVSSDKPGNQKAGSSDKPGNQKAGSSDEPGNQKAGSSDKPGNKNTSSGDRSGKDNDG